MADDPDIWLDWAVELQAIAQAGLAYTENPFDRERFERVRAIAAEMVARKSGLSLERVRYLFCNEEGYQTPKLDTRAAVFEGDRILLVRERDGRWSLPGGWADVGITLRENMAKEVKEEAGLDVEVGTVVAVQDRAKHNAPIAAHQVCVVFALCTATGGGFRENIETTESGYFALDELPPLCVPKTSEDQVHLCFEAHRSPQTWRTRLD